MAPGLLLRQDMRIPVLLLFVLCAVASCKSDEECGGCALRYCDEPAGACDCACIDGQVQNGATCKSGCFVRPAKKDVDCSLVGCGLTPLCATGCTEVCGCCPCREGEISDGLQCTGGCYVPLDAR